MVVPGSLGQGLRADKAPVTSTAEQLWRKPFRNGHVLSCGLFSQDAPDPLPWPLPPPDLRQYESLPEGR